MNRNRILPVSLAVALALTPALVFAADGDVSKVNGSISIDDGGNAGALDTVNGSISIGANARVESAETVNGSIKVGDAAQSKGDLETVNGSIRAGRNLVADSLSTVNGSIFVDRGGKLRGGVETVNGSIGLVGTELGGGIDTVNGDVTVGVDSHVSGGIHYGKIQKQWVSFGEPKVPRVIVGPNARVDGPLHFERKVELYVHGTAKTGAITGATAIRFDTPTPPEKAQ